MKENLEFIKASKQDVSKLEEIYKVIIFHCSCYACLLLLYDFVGNVFKRHLALRGI